ncbi:MAG: hypothetical protein WKF30_02355 [Pyrinomonadaceae bacterium]
MERNDPTQEAKALMLLVRIYELAVGQLSNAVYPIGLTRASGSNEDEVDALVKALSPLGYLWWCGMVELTSSAILLTERGKERAESFMRNVKEHVEAHPKAGAVDVSGTVN